MKKKNCKTEQINWEKVIFYGVSLGWMMSVLYLLILLTAKITA